MTTNAITTRYFDYAGSAPPFPEALEAQAAVAARWFGNPSALHGPGREARAELNRLKAELAALCGFTDGRVVLMSSATEANNWVIQGVMSRCHGKRIAVAADVHASVWSGALRGGYHMDVVPVDARGRVTQAAVANAIRSDTALLCCSHAANETGVIHDAGGIAAFCERKNVLCLFDGAQAVGHLPVDLAQIPCDFYTISAHKFGGPRGCGGVLLRSTECAAQMAGGNQEWGLRPGTEDLPALAGAAEALRRSLALLPGEATRLRSLTRCVVDALAGARIPFEINGDPETGLPGLLSVSFPGLDGHALAADLSLRGYAVATGSACHADQVTASRVILALGRPPETALGTVRVSFGRLTRDVDAAAFARVLVEVVTGQRALR